MLFVQARSLETSLSARSLCFLRLLVWCGSLSFTSCTVEPSSFSRLKLGSPCKSVGLQRMTPHFSMTCRLLRKQISEDTTGSYLCCEYGFRS